ncbi:hypothetical protein [Polyangium jinanense]|uniref:Uncharacterized protein n=1 Tax=Polyangium jinanense TaxID=2829994 RepID=A0A9X3XE76_9BACT|nr:hypothetical protein [Polyangium jinanense]MDC3960983.1 hypothetical protein [Polyangium jinanense]MDC3987403.1 hypothetical protein [Polyangium jinanense]
MRNQIVFGLCILVMGCASSSAPEVAESKAAVMALRAPLPRPTDPQCGACTYVINETLVYASLDGMDQMPSMDLILYTSTGEVLGKYDGLAPRTYAPGKATYWVSDGPTRSVEYGVLGWQGLTGYHTQKIKAVSSEILLPVE